MGFEEQIYGSDFDETRDPIANVLNSDCFYTVHAGEGGAETVLMETGERMHGPACKYDVEIPYDKDCKALLLDEWNAVLRHHRSIRNPDFQAAGRRLYELMPENVKSNSRALNRRRARRSACAEARPPRSPDARVRRCLRALDETAFAARGDDERALAGFVDDLGQSHGFFSRRSARLRRSIRHNARIGEIGDGEFGRPRRPVPRRRPIVVSPTTAGPRTRAERRPESAVLEGERTRRGLLGLPRRRSAIRYGSGSGLARSTSSPTTRTGRRAPRPSAFERLVDVGARRIGHHRATEPRRLGVVEQRADAGDRRRWPAELVAIARLLGLSSVAACSAAVKSGRKARAIAALSEPEDARVVFLFAEPDSGCAAKDALESAQMSVVRPLLDERAVS